MWIGYYCVLCIIIVLLVLTITLYSIHIFLIAILGYNIMTITYDKQSPKSHVPTLDVQVHNILNHILIYNNKPTV